MSAPSPARAGASFIGLTAWSLLALGVVAGLLALLQGMLAWFLEMTGITEQVLSDPLLAQLPASLVWILRHLFGLSIAILLLSVLTVAAGIGLLRRRDWARRLSIALMALGVFGNLAGVFWQARLLAELRNRAASLPPPLDSLIVAHYWSSQISSALFGLVFAVGFAWTVWRLMQPDVRADCGH